jgi:hypothetical protein
MQDSTYRVRVTPSNEEPIHARLAGDRRCSAPSLGVSVSSYAPVLALARILLRVAGLDPGRMLEVYRGDDDVLCFAVPLATAARLTVKDDKDGVPRFKSYVPFPADRVRPQTAANGPPAPPLAPPPGGACGARSAHPLPPQSDLVAVDGSPVAPVAAALHHARSRRG